MDIKPQQLRAERHPEVAAVLRRDAGLIIERWCRRAVEEQPHAARAHHDVLLDDLPAFLQELGRSLAEPYAEPNGWHRTSAARHGEQRWQHGWSLAEVVRDYQVLRVVILDYLEEALDRPPQGREVMAVGLALDEAISASVSRYARHEREAAEQRNRREADALREAERRKDEFLAVVAHELRNHLSPVSTSAAILGMDGVEAAAVRLARETMARQLGLMTRLVGDLLDVARLKQGKVTLRPQPVRLASVLAQAVETARPQVEVRGHALSVSVADEPPLTVDGDAGRLTQVFVNLLTNAAKYTPPGGQLGLSAAREGRLVVVRVRDNGVGIAPEMLGRVFDLFTQAGGAEGERGGLGVGLALVKSLVELHGGTVEAHSEGTGRGAEFVVRLPVGAGAAAPTGSVTPDQEQGAKDKGPDSRRVLVVDDKRDSADSLAMLLELLGHTARAAYDGPEALHVARQFRPEVVLLDIGLPTLGGLEVARRLREDPDLTGALLVAVSGYGAEEDLRRSRDAGFDGHLIKPCGLEDLEKLLKAMRAGPQ